MGLLLVGLFTLGRVAAEMYLGKPVDFSFTHSRFYQLAYKVLWVVTFLFLVWWASNELARAKKGHQ